MNNVTTSGDNLNTYENNLLEYGHMYVKEGLTIIPLDQKAQPLLSDWEQYKHAETRATFEEARQWVKRWPNLKWGLATGRGINLVVIHVKPGGNESRWPATVCSEAEDGGIYLFFAHPGFLRPKTVKVRSAKDFLPNTNIIGEDDYVVLQSQPFVQNASWINYFGEIDLAQIPDDILPPILEDPDYVMSDVPEGVQIPEMARLNASVQTTQFVKEIQDASNNQLLENDKKGPSQSTRLVNIVLINPDIVLFRDEYGVAHVQFPVGDHKEVWPCKSSAFTRWLGNEYYRLTKGKTVAGRESVKDAISLLEGRAINECPEHRLYNRIAQTPDAIWYDLGDNQFRAVKITKHGWEVVTDVPILFRRFSHLAPQVTPVKGGSVDEVLKFVNVTGEDQKILFLIHLVTSFIPGWPHPALYVYGTQGSAKSTLSRIDRMLIDPSRIEVVSLTRKEEELAQQLAHHSFLSFDNVSEMPDWIADLLCRAITGGGFSKRELYTNDDDVIRYVMANIGINGINLASNRADLLERCLLIKLERMKDRKQEHELMADFELARPKILGAVFDTVAKAMTLQPYIKVEELPRMADFAIWSCATAEALGIGQEAFLDAYFRNISSQSEELINDNTTATLIRGIVDSHEGKWEGSPTQLFTTFKTQAIAEQILDKRLPANPAALMRELNRLKTPLEEMGYKIISSSDGIERNVIICKVATE